MENYVQSNSSKAHDRETQELVTTESCVVSVNSQSFEICKNRSSAVKHNFSKIIKLLMIF